MKPTWERRDGAIRLYRADCRDVLPLAEPVETCITDPPYDLTANKRGGSGLASVNLNSPAGRARITAGFMGQSWDGTGIAFDPATWTKVLASLLPGAMLLAFGSTRTYHRMTCAIEDAGFEIRDCLAWMYGQGFPKSHDISKAIDRAAGAEREVVGVNTNGSGPHNIKLNNHGRGDTGIGYMDGSGKVFDITAPATDAAKQWSGYGTALKPAFEPIVLAMKPLAGTFAENAQRHGVAGLNIDGCRIGTDDVRSFATRKPGTQKFDGQNHRPHHDGEAAETVHGSACGRWPANVVADEAAGAMIDEQTGTLTSGTGAVKRATGSGYQANAYGKESRPEGTPNVEYGDSGGASRFFYCPKADSEDRRGSKHPTVKPVDLIKWLCKLTMTPTGGTVLDPFMGSGTTMEACYELRRPFIGIEREASYFDDVVSRAKEMSGQYSLLE